VSRIPWSTYEGEDIERIIAIMLCSENPSVVAVRPGRGDGGLDVIVPAGDERHDVYQVKRFAATLGSSHKSQIEESYRRLLRSIEDGIITVRNWYLTMPLNPTPGNVTWFRDLTADAPFECEWRGLVFCERLVTDHENVVDYYLRDGKDRLATALRDTLMVALGRDLVESNGALPATVLGDSLKASARLVDTDPHYRYGFRLLPEMPGLEGPSGAVFTHSQWEPEVEMWLCVDVYPKFVQALELEPITVNIAIHVDDSDSPLARVLSDFDKFGKPFTAPLGTADVDAQAGHLVEPR
jgi:hypothetical protein